MYQEYDIKVGIRKGKPRNAFGRGRPYVLTSKSYRESVKSKGV